ncbi:glutathione ABC transporter substrate-binding protein [Arvimicrobium flavum]|uniref:glutathione ABC transporter substrate-binding protein n=1 Tax=Arvimicrobium flavum TaxID=3393320 RepID=UPI00237AB78B|nr:glutathione ABC transporter substrate-binding protein [Mesorhizobium shangrilense]
MLRLLTRRLFLTAFAASATMLAASTIPSAAQTSVLRYATGTDAQTLDPQFVTDIPTSRVVMQLHETLVYPNAEGDIQPVLAESWTVSEDNLSWTFKLREGVTFHDGTPFNADAVKFTFDRILAEATGSPRKSSAAAIDTVEVVDEHTVTIKTKAPFAPLLAQLSAYNLSIISPKSGTAIKSDYSKAPAGTGPFRLGDWTPGEKLTVIRNEDYWGEKAKLDEVRFTVVPEDSARVLMLLSGEVDMVSNIPPVMVDRLQGAPGVQVVEKTGVRTIYVAFNLAMKPFDDLRVRQAMAHAINTEALLKGVMNNLGTPGGGLESVVIPGSAAIDPYPYDPERARALLAEAGLSDGFSVDFYLPTGRYINDRQLGEAIQAQLAEVGITANLQAPEFGTYLSMLEAKDKIPMFLLGKGSPTGDPDFTLTINVGSEGTGNYGNYHNKTIDDLLLKQRGTVDVEQRRAMLREIIQTAYDDVPWIVLFYENQIFGQRENVSGVAVLPNENLRFVTATVN